MLFPSEAMRVSKGENDGVIVGLMKGLPVPYDALITSPYGPRDIYQSISRSSLGGNESDSRLVDPRPAFPTLPSTPHMESQSSGRFVPQMSMAQ